MFLDRRRDSLDPTYSIFTLPSRRSARSRRRNSRNTADGLELQFGTNMLGHYTLSALLMPALELAATESPDRPRIVTIASIAHKQGEFANLFRIGVQAYPEMDGKIGICVNPASARNGDAAVSSRPRV